MTQFVELDRARNEGPILVRVDRIESLDLTEGDWYEVTLIGGTLIKITEESAKQLKILLDCL